MRLPVESFWMKAFLLTMAFGLSAAPPRPVTSQLVSPVLKPSLKVVAKGFNVHGTVRMGTDNPYSAATGRAIFITWMPVDGVDGYKVTRGHKLLTPQLLKKAVNPGDILKTTSEEWESVAKSLRISDPSQFFAANELSTANPPLTLLDRDRIRWALAQIHANVARVMGTGLLDTDPNLKAGETYSYEVRAYAGSTEYIVGSVPVLCQDSRQSMAAVTSGQFSFFAGDQYVELLWPRTDSKVLAGYDVFRAEQGIGAFSKVNTTPVVAVVKRSIVSAGALQEPLFAQPLDDKGKLKTNAQSPPVVPAAILARFSFIVDQTVLDSSPQPPGPDGTPGPPKVIKWLKNDQPYLYKVVPRDMMGPGTDPNQTVTVVPRDLLPPGIPQKLLFGTIESPWTLPKDVNPAPCLCRTGSCADAICCMYFLPNKPEPGPKFPVGLKISWWILTRNSNNCPESIASYTLFRYPTRNDALGDVAAVRTQVAQRNLSPYMMTQHLQSFEDKPLVGDIVYWYRLKVEDRAGHSSLSGPFSASLPDKIPPLAPHNVRTTPLDETSSTRHIALAWEASRDALAPGNPCMDVAAYRIFRKVCGARPPRRPGETLGQPISTVGWDDDLFRLVGEVPASQLQFKDTTLPVLDNPIASTLCYEYCVRAVDKAGNVSFDSGGNLTCNRLKKIQGPKSPTITSLLGRTSSVRIDWVAPPVPDLYTFRIFRSESDPQQGNSSWTQVNFDPDFSGTVYCELTPPEGFPFAKGLNPAKAGAPAMHEGSFVNTYWYVDTLKVEPNRKYWYKIVSLDYWMNPFANSASIAQESTSPVMSTFAYRTQDFAAVTLQKASYDSYEGVQLVWSKAAGKDLDYILYRRNKQTQPLDFGILAAKLLQPAFVDKTARPGESYFYAVQYVTSDGHVSALSNSMEVSIPDLIQAHLP